MSEAELTLPEMVCLRVTRACNARCGFCLAPPDGNHPSTETLVRRIDWLFDHGVGGVHLCGGEPTLCRGLSKLLVHIRARSGKIRLTTNGICMPEDVLDQLRAGAEVKVSVHGDRERHDRIVGCHAYEPAVATIRRLVAKRVHTTVQTTVLAGGAESLDAVVRLSLEIGVRRLSVMPFIPRGNGRDLAPDLRLNDRGRRLARDTVRRIRRRLGGRLEVRWIDLTTRPIHVVEPDGRLMIEGRSEEYDVELARLDRPRGSAPLPPRREYGPRPTSSPT